MFLRTTFSAGLLLVATVAAAGPVAAAPSDEVYCPTARSGFVVWDVSTEPYGVDNYVDEIGNNNGVVCARPTHFITGDDGNPFQIYNFIDDVVPVEH
jgi:hypothetical protein